MDGYFMNETKLCEIYERPASLIEVMLVWTLAQYLELRLRGLV